MVNITKIILLLSIFIIFNKDIRGQKYSIDDGRLRKSGKISLKYTLYQSHQTKEDREERRIMRKEVRERRKARRIHINKLQTKKVKKEMKKLYRSAKRINNQKPQKYLHERVYSTIINESKLGVVKTKLVIANSIRNVKDVVGFSKRNETGKKQRYFQ